MTFNEIDRTAYQVLMNAGVTSLSVNLHQVISYAGSVRAVGYRALSRRLGREIEADLPSKDGLLYPDGTGRYFILYNDDHHIHRRRWTIAHELGHYFLGHLRREPRNQAEDDWMESEANRFAQTLLTPLPVIRAIGEEDPFMVARMCKISEKAATYALRGRKYTDSPELVEQMSDYIKGQREVLACYREAERKYGHRK